MPASLVLSLILTLPSSASLTEDAGFFLKRGLDASEREAVVKQMAGAMAKKYSLWHQKEQILKGGSARAHLESCAARERSIPSSTRLAFEERLRVCSAGFRDTHLQAQPQVARPFVWAGAEIGEVEGRFVLQRVSRTLTTIHPQLKPGARVLSVNGLTPVEWIRRLAPYIPASSSAYQRRAALRAILHRDFAYPLRQVLHITFETGTLELTWWQLGPNQRSDLRELFEERGIRHVSSFDPALEERLRAGTEMAGFAEETPLPSAEPLTEFLNERGEVGLRVGYLGKERACYVQLLTFSARSWRPAFASRILVPFEAPLQSFAAACHKKALPLVLDLRFNPGGDPELARKVVEAFGRPGASQTGLLFSARRTEHTEQLLEAYKLGPGYPEPENPLASMRLRPEALRIAERDRAAYLPWVAQETIVTAPDKGFSGNVLALISPYCISTCEIAAGLLQSSKRARLLGEPTNGTGGRFLELGETPSAAWRDDVHGTVVLRIPNTLFAVEPADGRDPAKPRPFRDWSHLLRENRPQEPEETLRPGLQDPGTSGAVLLEKVLARIR